jgi:hypothetical protein
MEQHVNRSATCSLSALVLILFLLPAHAQSTDSVAEFAFMPATKTVTLLNEGGKYVAVDLRHIPEGGTCRMDKDATIFKIGPGGTPGTIRVRYAAPQISSGGCPFLTIFELPDAEYAAVRATFVAKEEEANKKVEEIKKNLGDKWNEVTGQKP